MDLSLLERNLSNKSVLERRTSFFVNMDFQNLIDIDY